MCKGVRLINFCEPFVSIIISTSLIISLLEPRISGVKADTIIAKLGWDKPHRVEAVGFSRVTQFLGSMFLGWPLATLTPSFHQRIKKAIMLKVIDASPLVNFWTKLICMTWVFRGGQFTWHRGNLSERLDRVVGNDAWIKAFPNCLITHLPRIKSDHRPLLLKFCYDDNCAPNRPFNWLATSLEFL
ncbi:(+)-neomenthol dehydrogenase-like [Gossypium australe]|uniref:(+)-neomenthol dehydrogenase-like n=1 Tax=Gossypium australe TaxID=47621 RepID=A0A5B6WZY5_9ROSI|nr:(+)-neomenthol dehydrogenase-like [Gossypium australe]